MRLVFGPVLKQREGYTYDSWVPAQGVRRSYAYSRIEDAYYALKSAIEEAAGGGCPAPVVCRTSDEFRLNVDGAWFVAA